MDIEIDKDFALFYGIMLGDGCLSLVRRRMKFVVITGSLDDDLPFFKDVIHPILEKYRGKKTQIKFRKNCRAIEFNFTDKRLFDFIKEIGFPTGKKGDKIFIPQIFYEKGLVNYVVSGFMATDGSLVLTKNPNKYYPRIEAYAICKILLSQIYEYLTLLGMNGGFYKAKRVKDTRVWKHTQEIYRFQFNGAKNLDLFKEKIGFANPKQKEKFVIFLDYCKNYKAGDKTMTLGRIELPISAFPNK